MILTEQFAAEFPAYFQPQQTLPPWEIVRRLEETLMAMIARLPSDFIVSNNIAIHRDANVEHHAILKAPVIVSEGCFIGAHAYLRGGVFLGDKVTIGPGSEIKSSIILAGSALAHFNFVGDSVIGSHVNMEAGSVIANHFNERKDKTIYIRSEGKKIPIDTQKFGALVGDGTKIGANAVLSPGTILPKYSVVKRLELIDQCP